MTWRRQVADFRLPLLFSIALHLFCLAGGAPRSLPLALPETSLQAVLTDGRKQEVAEQPVPTPVHQPSGDRPSAKQTRLAIAAERPSAVVPSALPAALLSAPGPSAEAALSPGSPSLRAEAAAAPAPTSESISADGLRQYRLALAREARRLKRYPPLARERGWEGTAQIAAVFASAAEPTVALAHSSGHAALDEQALLMITRAVQSAELPESLRGRQFRVLVPVQFSLDD